MSCCAICAVDREYAASAHGGYTQPTGIKAAAERTSTRTAGAGPPCLCPANRKNGHASAANHVGTAKGTVSYDRTNRRKCAAPAHGRCAHPVRTGAAAERTSDHAAGAGPPCLCSASHKGGRVSTVNHAGTAARMSCCAVRAIDREYAASAHGGYTHPARSKAAAERTNVSAARARETCVCAAGKEIPRRETVCAG